MANRYNPEYLEHHGILGMKWGVENGPPYPLNREKHNKVVKKGQSEKKQNLIDKAKGHAKAKKRAKQRAAALEKARQARRVKQEKEKREKYLEENKERVLKSGSAKELAQYKGRLSNKELQDAWNRLELEAKIISKAQAQDMQPDKVEEFFKKLSTVTDYTKKGIDAWDTFADVYNAFNPSGKTVKKIKGGKKKKKDDDDD